MYGVQKPCKDCQNSKLRDQTLIYAGATRVPNRYNRAEFLWSRSIVLAAWWPKPLIRVYINNINSLLLESGQSTSLVFIILHSQGLADKNVPTSLKLL